MRTDAITVRLRLPGMVVVDVREGARAIEVATRYARKEALCPRCGGLTERVHQWQRQWKRDAPLWGKMVWILLWKRRFRCQTCRSVFTEDDPACGRRRRTTLRLREQAGREAQEANVRAVARRYGVSEGLVERSWQERYGQVRSLSRSHVLLGMDGFCARRRRRMWTDLWDLESREPIAVIDGERQADAQRLLERHADRKTVQAVAIDLSEPYRQAIEMVLPDAAIVADHFHVVALAGQALQEVRGGRRLHGNLAWLLDRGVERLRPEERDRLHAALAKDPTLAKAWALKEGLRQLYRYADGEQATAALVAWLRAAEASQLPSFQRLAGTLGKWRREVLNYWRYPITNAVVEGKHNRVKVLKRRAYGYRNERNFTLRILNCFHAN